MKYECKCTPIQNYPHIVKSPSVKRYWGGIYRHLSTAKSCDGHPIPLKEWEWKKFSFGKIIY